MFQLLVLGSVFVCVASLVGGIAIILRHRQTTGAIENRLSNITQNGGIRTQTPVDAQSVLTKPLEDIPNQLEEFIGQYFNLPKFIDQSGVKISVSQFVLACFVIGGVGGALCFVAFPIKMIAPFAGILAGTMPMGFLWFKRGRRLKKFQSQMPEALGLMSRALRAGHSLPAGFQLVAQQLSEPIGSEFQKCYEQQNLGVTLEESIRAMTERVPNVDLRFFATAVILQRQTGGDLAEILDKISHLIRERFVIWGQIQALTGEGRLSGIVLLALPPALFVAMLKLNYDYVMLLFNEPLGQQMLVFGIVMQLIGAAVIKKIITIKV